MSDLHPVSTRPGDGILRVVNSLHQAFADESRWGEFLADLAGVCGARRAVLMPLDAEPDEPFLASHGFPRAAASQWHSYFKRLDPWLNAGGLPEPGRYSRVEGEALVPDEALRMLKFYSEFLAPNDLRWLRGFWIRPDAGQASPYGVLLWRGVDQPSFDHGVLDTLDTVARAIVAFERVSVANALSRAAGLDHEAAAFLLDRRGRLLMSNGSADALLRREVATLRAGRLVLANPVADRWLHALLEQAGADPMLLATPSRCRESLPGLGRSRLELAAMRPIGAAPALLGWRFSVTLRAETDGSRIAVRRTAQKIYRWTNAEFDAVSRLADGEALPEIARQRQSTIETVRSHLKNAKRKAGVRRQVDLVRIITSLEP